MYSLCFGIKITDLIFLKKYYIIYNVSDNAIRKWCDKYDLSRKSSEIKKFSDEEWLKI